MLVWEESMFGFNALPVHIDSESIIKETDKTVTVSAYSGSSERVYYKNRNDLIDQLIKDAEEHILAIAARISNLKELL